MPNTVKKEGDKYRVVEADTGKVTKNKAGTAVDGGGYKDKHHAEVQAHAINAAQHAHKK